MYERYRGRLIVDKIRLYRLRWTGHLVCLGEDDSAQKVDRSIYMVAKDLVDPASDNASG